MKYLPILGPASEYFSFKIQKYSFIEHLHIHLKDDDDQRLL